MSMSSDYDSNGFLSFQESLIVTLIPAVIFLMNGVFVLFLKTFELSIGFYFIFPAMLILTALSGLMFLRKLETKSLVSGVKKYAFVLCIPLIFSLGHFFIFGSSYGGDTASYFTNPIHTFSDSGYFSHAEDPFFEYGEQPLAVYWLPANSEFMFAGLGHIFGLEYREILALMHIYSNYLLGLVVLALALRFFNPIQALVFCACFFCLLYGLLNHRRDFTSASLFRGFENKGFIWGYFFWATVNLLSPRGSHIEERKTVKSVWLFSAGFLLGAAAFLVSGNAINLLFLALALMVGGIVSKQFGSIYAFLGLVVSLLGMAALFKLLEVTSVYAVATPTPNLQKLTLYETHKSFMEYPFWVWAMCGLTVLTLWFWERKLCFFLGAFLCVAAVLRSEIYFNIFTGLSTEFAIVFWRHVTLVNPLLVLFFGGCVLIGLMAKRARVFAGLTIMVCACGVGILAQALRLPSESPFGDTESRPEMQALAKICPSGSKILANIRLSTHLPTLQPSYEYLIGKEPFMNWQIANLKSDSDARERASQARSAGLFMIRNQSNAAYAEDFSGLEYTIKFAQPDAIFLSADRVTDENDYIFEGYKMQRYKRTIAFTKPTCQSNFSDLVEEEIDKETAE